jgi:transcriptional regulator with XRE-family HTH domain
MGHEQPKKLAEKLLRIRMKLRLSQVSMANSLERHGVKAYPGYVARYELGERVPGPLTLLAYAELASISTDVLINDKRDLPKGF